MNEVQSLTFANIGSGGTLGTLPNPTGNILIGGVADTDAGSAAIVTGSVIGPNVFASRTT